MLALWLFEMGESWLKGYSGNVWKYEGCCAGFLFGWGGSTFFSIETHYCIRLPLHSCDSTVHLCAL